MPRLRRPDGVELHWEERGAGPTVIFSPQFFGFPGVFGALESDLAADHRVVTYHLRGTGSSSRQGPYDMETDIADLEAVIEEVGAPALVIGLADGCNRAVKVAAERPDLVSAVVTPGGNPIGREAAEGTDALVSSPSVIEALAGMMDTDYRAALRTIISSANTQMTEDEARERVASVVRHCPPEAGAPRLRAWIDDVALEESRAIGARLWLLEHGVNPWFPAEASRRTRELLPEAHIEEVEDGPLSRPDITSAAIRRLASAGRAVGEPAGRGGPA